MKKQTFKNHIRFYTPHHFVFYPVMLVLMGFSLYNAFTDVINHFLWVALFAAFAVITWLSFMLRQHYALTLQNRLILIELRYRYLATTGKRFEFLEDKFTEGQLFALRFAQDEQLPQLAERALQEGLSPDEIKKQIVNWREDNRRV